MGRSKYLYPDRAGYQKHLERAEMEITVHRIALDALLRDEFVWTERFEGAGSWFQMGIARASAGNGGIVMIREFYPTNGKPSQCARLADGYIREMTTASAYHHSTLDPEVSAYWQCFYAVRALYNELTKVV